MYMISPEVNALMSGFSKRHPLLGSGIFHKNKYLLNILRILEIFWENIYGGVRLKFLLTSGSAASTFPVSFLL